MMTFLLTFACKCSFLVIITIIIFVVVVVVVVVLLLSSTTRFALSETWFIITSLFLSLSLLSLLLLLLLLVCPVYTSSYLNGHSVGYKLH